jgi:tRNA A37 methylthiotransferase MiaB
MSIQAKHDFAAKLGQEALLPLVLQYVTWQRAVRKAMETGNVSPPMPEFAPTSINLDLTTACNYACDHCIDFDTLNQPAKYEHDALLASLEDNIKRGLRSVILIGGGEPTLYPRFGEVVRFLKERSVQVAIVSNGSRNGKIHEIANVLSERDWVRLSLDSGTDETFQKMHKPKKPIGLEEICSWVPRIREQNPALSIGFSFIIVWEGAERDESVIVENIGEIVSATKLARDHGFSYISLKPFLTRHPGGAEVMDPSVIADFNATVHRLREAVAEAKAFETESFKVLESTNLRVLLDGTWRGYTNQPRNCHMTAFRQVVTPIGVHICPTHRGIPKARIGDGIIRKGRALGGVTQQQVARKILAFDAKENCKEITCLYNNANWWIEKMIEDGIDLSRMTPLPDQGDYYL